MFIDKHDMTPNRMSLGQEKKERYNEHLILIRLYIHIICFILAWVLKNENVQCVLLGASTVDQLYLNIQALQV